MRKLANSVKKSQTIKLFFDLSQNTFSKMFHYNICAKKPENFCHCTGKREVGDYRFQFQPKKLGQKNILKYSYETFFIIHFKTYF